MTNSSQVQEAINDKGRARVLYDVAHECIIHTHQLRGGLPGL